MACKDLNGFHLGERVLVKTEEELDEEFDRNSSGDFMITGEDYTMEVETYRETLGCEATIAEIIEKEEYIDIYLAFDGKRDSRLYTIPVIKHMYESVKPPEISSEILMAIAIGA